LQAVRVMTEAGALVLASDAAHYYENFLKRKPFPIVVDLQDMLDGFARLDALADRPALIVPGHDPLVRAVFPADMAAHVFRLDRGPMRELPG
jgi:glyoxylase-like metal-dependent hydrolase (beta-lactamase superfamily II)